jgi:hypothetical protein
VSGDVAAVGVAAVIVARVAASGISAVIVVSGISAVIVVSAIAAVLAASIAPAIGTGTAHDIAAGTKRSRIQSPLLNV